ncbi:hypothetical protein KC19_VG255000 [Ceratodon purpureus]|uniref:Uncharacterized protein n=1 Tax=Ceratodon purpureus TaxID=3225 RepID=A0A8T0HUB5_CERPU|nr:hypothetical protein KC19_VG255000 [Ceratodon purpureus]
MASWVGPSVLVVLQTRSSTCLSTFRCQNSTCLSSWTRASRITFTASRCSSSNFNTWRLSFAASSFLFSASILQTMCFPLSLFPPFTETKCFVTAISILYSDFLLSCNGNSSV